MKISKNLIALWLVAALTALVGVLNLLSAVTPGLPASLVHLGANK